MSFSILWQDLGVAVLFAAVGYWLVEHCTRSSADRIFATLVPVGTVILGQMAPGLLTSGYHHLFPGDGPWAAAMFPSVVTHLASAVTAGALFWWIEHFFIVLPDRRRSRKTEAGLDDVYRRAGVPRGSINGPGQAEDGAK